MKMLIESAINRYLALDPESKNRISALQGKIAAIELKGIALTFQLVFNAGSIQMEWDQFSIPDITIKGTPLNFLHMSIAKNQRARFFAEEDIIVEGNMELAQHVLAVFDELEIDWEEFFSRYIGDVPSHQAGRFLRHMKDFTRRVAQTLSRNTNEYIHEEVDLFPAHEALRDFFQDVDALRMDTDRLEARIEQLQKSMEQMD